MNQISGLVSDLGQCKSIFFSKGLLFFSHQLMQQLMNIDKLWATIEGKTRGAKEGATLFVPILYTYDTH
uniref:Uncharacterized protein n=1 Tax=Cucumis melo TaxID=3656 RepID=A0A9I9E668_CUCME